MSVNDENVLSTFWPANYTVVVVFPFFYSTMSDLLHAFVTVALSSRAQHSHNQIKSNEDYMT